MIGRRTTRFGGFFCPSTSLHYLSAAPVYRDNTVPVYSDNTGCLITAQAYATDCGVRFDYQPRKSKRKEKGSGWGGIRTHGRLPYASFQDWCLRPLGHPSVQWICVTTDSFVFRETAECTKRFRQTKPISGREFFFADSNQRLTNRCGDRTVETAVWTVRIQNVVRRRFVK